ncbi:Tyramine beta-hydroxylase [Gryllus bimaculatus]|nr:Tyramine beta-hydroxylase [Gryllus bimaculatus]
MREAVRTGVAARGGPGWSCGAGREKPARALALLLLGAGAEGWRPGAGAPVFGVPLGRGGRLALPWTQADEARPRPCASRLHALGAAGARDTWANEDGLLEVDKDQNCLEFRHVQRHNVTKFTFMRHFDTCDDHDYVIEYEAVIQPGNEALVHHMEVFHCEAPAGEAVPAYDGPCFAAERPAPTQVCKRVLAAWAMGALPFSYPEEAGLPIGGPDYNLYVMLEVHYNNPEQRDDWVDSSGVRLYLTPTLRKYDGGVIELGLEYTDKMAIPPGQAEFMLSGYCVTECTAVAVPADGIVVFGSQLHTHLTGVRVLTRHFRDGRELPELNRDNHYSTHFQEIRPLKRRVRVLPGDALITTCGYKTDDRDNITLGGFAISDEMCVNYVHYFPKIDLEVCKSSISSESLSTYFRFMHEWERQRTGASLGVSDNYRAIEWTPLRARLLADLYHEAPLSMQCNQSTGERFPGYWENIPVPPVLFPLPPPPRLCHLAH